MVEPEEKEQAQPEEKKEMRFEMRVGADDYQRLKKVARYAAVEGIIPDDYRGNMTAWVNYCLTLGTEMLKNHALKKRGC